MKKIFIGLLLTCLFSLSACYEPSKDILNYSLLTKQTLIDIRAENYGKYGSSFYVTVEDENNNVTDYQIDFDLYQSLEKIKKFSDFKNNKVVISLLFDNSKETIENIILE